MAVYGNVYGEDLIKVLETSIETYKQNIKDRQARINNGDTDMDDCFVSQRFEEREISLAERKIDLIRQGGCAWFTEYATLDGKLVNAYWCNTRYGRALRVEMPNGSAIWVNSTSPKALAKKGLKAVSCKRPAWFTFKANGSGMYGAYAGNYVTFKSHTNYATGEPASDEPIEIADIREDSIN